MATENKAIRPAVRVYCCGGAGINLGQKLKQYRNNEADSDIYSRFDICFIDTSSQNFVGRDINLEEEAFVFMKGIIDGSGQVRKQNYERIRSRYPEIFKKFLPADINIVLFSTGGGSGSVLSQVIIKYLIEQGLSTIAVAVGDLSTLKFAENTRDTWASMQGVSKVTQKPVIVSYHENTTGDVETDTDNQIIFSIVNVALLLSGAADRIDGSDINSWLNYTRVTTQPPSLTGLHIVADDQELPSSVKPFALLSINRDDSVLPRNENLDFSKIGVMADLPNVTSSLHFFLDKPSIAFEFKRIQERVAELKAISEARRANFDFADGADEDGMVI